MAMGVVQPQTNDSLMACDQQGRKEVGSSLGPRGNVVLGFIDMGPLLSVTVGKSMLAIHGVWGQLAWILSGAGRESLS